MHTCISHIVPISITPSGMNTAGGQYQLTCTVQSTATPTITWLGPPNDGPLPSDDSDTGMVSDVMSSGSTHTSILQFDPLQSSHEGSYTCQVTVGTVTEMRSIQVNVEGNMKIPATTTTQQRTTRPEGLGSDTTEGPSGGAGNSGEVPGDGVSTKKPAGEGGGSIGAAAGGAIVVLLIVSVSILLAVILLLYWWRR